VTWIFADYNDLPSRSFMDVAVLSHEVGEWADDPYYDNSTPCGTLEVGDPLVGSYTAWGGGNWHLQDLVFQPYFGDNGVSINNQFSFQNDTSLSVCSNGK